MDRVPYYLSKDLFAQAVYSVGQTLGVASVSYGAYLVLIDNDYQRFKKNIDHVKSLSRLQKDQLAAGFLIDNAERARNVRKIRVIGHSLTAGLNLSSALTTSQRELKTALFFLGGINTLAAVSFGFSRSEEENLGDSVRNWDAGPMVQGGQNPSGGLALRVGF